MKLLLHSVYLTVFNLFSFIDKLSFRVHVSKSSLLLLLFQGAMHPFIQAPMEMVSWSTSKIVDRIMKYVLIVKTKMVLKSMLVNKLMEVFRRYSGTKKLFWGILPN